MTNQIPLSPSGKSKQIKTIFRWPTNAFVAFGALVLVPLITGLDSNTALLTAGVGTLLFHFAQANKCLFSWHHLLPLSRPFNMAYKLGELRLRWAV